ncbi:alpha/beta hydrolase [Pseudonocardia bannensis]|uniref:Alpha/beta hydrolase n=1 Tax=Pseudonocardia bannensis TaxID=630973 RepID=A0A848DB57_9PSEU|nr:alpha/beta hydrolase [Pseudonocardia bannensis]NMH90072.1 alpha/beta hydrolase [Pseudonocardia bannensis]
MRLPAVPRPLMRALVRYGVRPVLSAGVPEAFQRRWLEIMTAPTPLPSGVRVTRDRLAGRPALRLTPPGADPARAVLYLHGGGFTIGSPATHRALAGHLADAAGATVYVLDYRLAPEHPYPAALDDTTAAYRELLERGYAAEHLSIAGDSAGGWLTLRAGIELRDAGTPLPALLVLISPVVDLGPTDRPDDAGDPMLQKSWIRSCIDSFASGRDPRSPELSPVYADLAGLPPLWVHVGSDEILYDDSVRIVERARAAGVRADLRRLDGLWHVAHAHAGLLPEATAAVAELGGHIRQATLPLTDTTGSSA